MKKILFLIICFFISSILYATENNITFQKLGNKQCFSYTYNNSEEKNLKVFIEENGFKKKLFELSNQYGNIYISSDGKKLIYSSKLNMENKTWNYYLIDGTKGTITFLVTEHQRIITSKDLDYYIILGKYIENVGQELIIHSIFENMDYSVFWNVKSRLGGSCVCYRSLYDDFLFRIDYEQEGFLYGSSFYDVKNNQLYELYNITDSHYGYEKKRNHSKYELGMERE